MDITKYAILKKLAGGGGGGGDTGVMVVNFSLNVETDNFSVVADKTVEEVKTAMYTKVVIGVLTAQGVSSPLGPCMIRGSDSAIGFAPAQGSQNLLMCIYSTKDNSWAFAGGQ